MVTISPMTTELFVSPVNQHIAEVAVGLPAKGAVGKIDVYFLTDATGSMGPIIDAVSKGASEIFSQLRNKAAEVGADVNFGAGYYRDFTVSDVFQHQVSLTPSSSNEVEQAIANWSAGSGADGIAEANLYALDQLAQPPGGSIGWRANSKRVIVWFGDVPSYDPICQQASGLSYDITEANVTTRLQQQNIFVIAISTPTGSQPGLDGDPTQYTGSTMQGNCGTGGSAGQASRITSATGGEFADKINPSNVVETIIKLAGGQVSQIGNVQLKPDKKIAPFVAGVKPELFGPLPGGQQHELDFQVTFDGVATSGTTAATKPVSVQGKFDVVVDGVVNSQQNVQIWLPDISGRYKFQCAKTGRFLQLKDASWPGDGANVNQGEDASQSYQEWELIPVSGGGYQIKNVQGDRDRYLEVVGQSSDSGAEVLTRETPSGPHKQWVLVPAGSDSEGVIYKIQNMYSGKVLDVKNSSEPDPPIIQWNYWGDYPVYQKEHNQHWRLIPV